MGWKTVCLYVVKVLFAKCEWNVLVSLPIKAVLFVFKYHVYVSSYIRISVFILMFYVTLVQCSVFCYSHSDSFVVFHSFLYVILLTQTYIWFLHTANLQPFQPLKHVLFWVECACYYERNNAKMISLCHFSCKLHKSVYRVKLIFLYSIICLWVFLNTLGWMTRKVQIKYMVNDLKFCPRKSIYKAT